MLYYNNRLFERNKYEEKLIHKTKLGEMVRSKLEGIIANILFDYGITDYRYENALKLNRITIHPDFTIFLDGKRFIGSILGCCKQEKLTTS